MRTPYIITKELWDVYYDMQQSAQMNMFRYPTVVYIISHNAYPKALKHFNDEGNTSDLVID